MNKWHYSFQIFWWSCISEICEWSSFSIMILLSKVLTYSIWNETALSSSLYLFRRMVQWLKAYHHRKLVNGLPYFKADLMNCGEDSKRILEVKSCLDYQLLTIRFCIRWNIWCFFSHKFWPSKDYFQGVKFLFFPIFSYFSQHTPIFPIF